MKVKYSKCNLERIAIAESNRKRLLNQQTELAAPTSDHAIINLILTCGIYCMTV